MCSRPSMPPRSTKAPKSVMFLTTPVRTWPFSSSEMRVRFFSSRSCSSTMRRLTTTLRRRLFFLMIRHSISSPIMSSRLGTWRRATCEPGRNVSTPHSLTTRPPLMRRSTVPVDDLAVLVGDLDLVPDLQEVGALLGEHDQPVLVLDLLEEDVELVARA